MGDIETVRRIKRVRTNAARVTVSSSLRAAHIEEMKAILKSISNLDLAIARNSELRKGMAEQLFGMMQESGTGIVDIKEAVAQIKMSKGRNTSYIDPRDFYDAVNDNDDFFNSVKVMIEKAEQVLSGRELDAIKKTIPGKAGAPALSIELKGSKK